MYSLCRVLVFKEVPEILYTGLSKVIGQPRDHQRNIEEPEYFNSDISISIPVEDTYEYAQFSAKLLVSLTLTFQCTS